MTHSNPLWTPEREQTKQRILADLQAQRGWMQADGKNALVEMRVINHPEFRTISGYYDDFELLAEHAAAIDGQANIFVTLNEINPALAARAYNRMESFAKNTTQDGDIIRRRFLLIDCDPVRPSGISATEEEHQAALDKGRAINKWLRSEFGWKSTFALDSGNGCHLLIPLDIAPEPPHTADDDRRVVEHCLKYLDSRFSDGSVKIDTTTFNASRIAKLSGTLAVKGDDLPERRHRRAKLLFTPKTIVPLGREDLMRLGDLYEPNTPQRGVADSPRRKTQKAAQAATTGPYRQQTGFDVRTWLDEMHIVYTEKQQGGELRYLVDCPFNPDHNTDSPAVWQMADGTACFHCFHATCADKHWADFRDQHEPGYRSKHEWASNPQVMLNLRQPREIIEDILRNLAESNDPLRFFSKDGRLVSVDVFSGHVRVVYLIVSKLREVLIQRMDFVTAKIGKDGVTYTPAWPNDNLLSTLVNCDGYPGFPEVEHIVNHPLFAEDGSIAYSNGYHPASKSYIYAADVEITEIEPTQANALDAVRWLTNTVMGDFVWADEASRVHALLFLIQPLIRRLIKGSTPFLVIDAPAPGSGKTMLAKLLSMTYSGRWETLKYTNNDEEFAKIMLAHLINSPSHCVYDNVTGHVQNGTLDAILTSYPAWKGRKLGQSLMVDVHQNATFLMTTNQATLFKDTATRSVYLRLDTGLQDPSRRHFATNNYEQWVLDNRGEILSSLICIVRYWMAEGRPMWKGVALHRMAAWQEVMWGIADVIGLSEHFLANRNAMEKRDVESGAWDVFVEAWWLAHGGLPQTARELFEIAFGCSYESTLADGHVRTEGCFSSLAIYKGHAHDDNAELGRQLAVREGRVYGIYKIVIDRDLHKKINTYCLVKNSPPSDLAGECGDQDDSAPALD